MEMGFLLPSMPANSLGPHDPQICPGAAHNLLASATSKKLLVTISQPDDLHVVCMYVTYLHAICLCFANIKHHIALKELA